MEKKAVIRPGLTPDLDNDICIIEEDGEKFAKDKNKQDIPKAVNRLSEQDVLSRLAKIDK